MKTPSEIFKKKKKKILNDQPNSSTAEFIKRIQASRSYSTYYSLFDDLSFRIGLTILAIPIIDNDNRTISYQPVMKYYPHNKLNEEPRNQKLSDNNLNYDNCHSLLAKELIYRIQRIPNRSDFL